MGGGGGWRKSNLSYPWNLPWSSLVFVWVLLAVHFRPSSEFLAVDRSVSHTFISRLPFIHQFSVLLPSRQFSLSDGFGPVENSAVPHGTQGAPTSAVARANRLVAGSFQKAASGPQRTWQDPPQKNPHDQSVDRQAVAGLLRPWLKRRLTARLSPCCVAIF